MITRSKRVQQKIHNIPPDSCRKLGSSFASRPAGPIGLLAAASELSKKYYDMDKPVGYCAAVSCSRVKRVADVIAQILTSGLGQ